MTAITERQADELIEIIKRDEFVPEGTFSVEEDDTDLYEEDEDDSDLDDDEDDLDDEDDEDEEDEEEEDDD